MRREQAAAAAVQQALREQQRAAARQRRLDELAQDPEAAWAEAEQLISAKQPARYAAAVTLLRDLQELAQRDGQAQAFARRLMALRDAHLRKPSLIAGSTEPDSPPDCGPGALPRLLTCCLPLGEASVKPGI
jgi:hypothetical protein